MKKKISIIIFAFFCVAVYSQEAHLQNKWLVILSGFEEKEQAIESSKKYDLETEILLSDDYDNLNPGWFIVVIPFDNENAALSKSKELKDKRINNYVKYSGNLQSGFTAFGDNVKLIVAHRYVVLDKLAETLSYKSRNHKLVFQEYGTPVDLFSDIATDEIPQKYLSLLKRRISLLDGEGKRIENVSVNRFLVFSRLQIETYRPEWCFESENVQECIEGDYPEDSIKRYIWDNEKNSRYLVAEINNNNGVLALINKNLEPNIYKEISLKSGINIEMILDTIPESVKIQELYNSELPAQEKEGALKWYNNKYSEIKSRGFVLNGDTLFYLSAEILDNPCGGFIEESMIKSWRIKNGELINIRPVHTDFNFILRFEEYGKTLIYKYNYNSNSLDGIDDFFEISLPYSFIDPWEC